MTSPNTGDSQALFWRLSWRADAIARDIADRHYNRQSIGSTQFVPPGRCLVLLADSPALWVTSWPFAEYVKHAWPGPEMPEPLVPIGAVRQMELGA